MMPASEKDPASLLGDLRLDPAEANDLLVASISTVFRQMESAFATGVQPSPEHAAQLRESSR
jgi:hypothetical protein